MGRFLEFRTLKVLRNDNLYIEDIRETSFIIREGKLYCYPDCKLVRDLSDSELGIVNEMLSEMLSF